MTLTKTGLGTQILSGANTYTGATFINAGTLSLGANNVLPTTAVSIDSATLDATTFTDTTGTLDLTGSATLHLDADGKIAFADSSAIDWTGGTLSITGTFVPGSSLRFGTTSAGLTTDQLARIFINGNAMHLALDSSGYLITGYPVWKATHAPFTIASADEDGDGVANAIEYILGGSISSNDLARHPQATIDSGTLFFSFIRDQASIDGLTTVEIQVSETLTDWPTTYPVPATAVATYPGVTVQKDTPIAGQDTITLSLPITTTQKKFARLKVTVP